MARVLLLGKDGQLGRSLSALLGARHEVTVAGRAECDLFQAGAVAELVARARPEVIVNAAAYTTVDRAEAEPEAARRVNAEAVRELAAAARNAGARVIHFSTDYVFDGEKSSAYVESDATSPLNVYGRTKLDGERALAESGVPHLVLRTSWAYAAVGKNFLHTMLRLGRDRGEVRVVDDQTGAPTSAEDLAEATMEILEKWTGQPGGIYHATSQGETTWAGLARAIFEEARMDVKVIPIQSSEYPTPARRPKNSRLNCDTLHRDFGIRLPNWKESLSRVMHSITK